MADYNVIQMKNKAGVPLFPKTKINLVEGAEAFVNELIANQIHMNVQKVDSLESVTAPKENVIYLVAKEGEEGNVHNEYIYTNGKFELIGDTAVSLAGYATEEFVSTAISNKVTELNLGQYAQASDLTALDVRVTTAEGKVSTLEGEMDDVQEFVNGADAKYATITYVDEQIEAVNETITDLGVGAIEGRVATLEGEMDDVQERLGTVESTVEQNSTDIAKNAEDIAKNAKAIVDNKAAIEQTVADNKAAIEQTVADNKAAIEKTVADNKAAIEGTVSTLAENVIYFDIVETVTE